MYIYSVHYVLYFDNLRDLAGIALTLPRNPGRKHPPDIPVVPARHSKMSALLYKKKRKLYEKMCSLILLILYFAGPRGEINSYVLSLNS